MKRLRAVKWWYQRANRGYSDRDMWNGDVYLAGIIASTLEWYVDKGIGIPMSYAYGLDEYQPDFDIMKQRRNEEYNKHIAIFKEYAKNGCAVDKRWQKDFGGVLDKDIRKSVKWLSKHFTELWD